MLYTGDALASFRTSDQPSRQFTVYPDVGEKSVDLDVRHGQGPGSNSIHSAVKYRTTTPSSRGVVNVESVSRSSHHFATPYPFKRPWQTPKVLPQLADSPTRSTLSLSTNVSALSHFFSPHPSLTETSRHLVDADKENGPYLEPRRRREVPGRGTVFGSVCSNLQRDEVIFLTEEDSLNTSFRDDSLAYRKLFSELEDSELESIKDALEASDESTHSADGMDPLPDLEDENPFVTRERGVPGFLRHAANEPTPPTQQVSHRTLPYATINIVPSGITVGLLALFLYVVIDYSPTLVKNFLLILLTVLLIYHLASPDFRPTLSNTASPSPPSTTPSEPSSAWSYSSLSSPLQGRDGRYKHILFQT